MARVGKIHAVIRATWSLAFWGKRPVSFPELGADGNEFLGLPLFCALTASEAETRCRELEREARRQVPVGLALELLWRRNQDVLPAAIAKFGLPPLDLSATDHKKKAMALAAWWEGVAAEITPEQNAGLWDELFPGHRFYFVAELPLED